MSEHAISPDWGKGAGLLPAVVQHWHSGAVLMLGYMNEEALRCTTASGKVTFWSRSRNRLWTKGETSGNLLVVRSVHFDCDGDAILVLAEPHGPTCHLGSSSCFGEGSAPALAFFDGLDALLAQRERERPSGSYTGRLFAEGVRRIAQKVGEEGVETALAAVTQEDADFVGEAADLLFHLMVLVRARGRDFGAVVDVLRQRAAAR
jgi:phosphoribosyl-AMP cyclohydrolase / phosphoribosyl-ATP pyrophosphohydrolase